MVVAVVADCVSSNSSFHGHDARMESERFAVNTAHRRRAEDTARSRRGSLKNSTFRRMRTCGPRSNCPPNPDEQQQLLSPEPQPKSRSTEHEAGDHDSRPRPTATPAEVTNAAFSTSTTTTEVLILSPNVAQPASPPARLPDVTAQEGSGLIVSAVLCTSSWLALHLTDTWQKRQYRTLEGRTMVRLTRPPRCMSHTQKEYGRFPVSLTQPVGSSRLAPRISHATEDKEWWHVMHEVR
ncbi:hypothetical protein H181DRAFT_03334 [Streptomyces sp. WMMB 714]|nr:hypothetical protein H181DRAFT_03334 [Streptomyces sp. WMMB 714]